MPDLFHFNAEMHDYYRTLPPDVRVQIAQSAAALGSLADLKTLAETLMQQSGNIYHIRKYR